MATKRQHYVPQVYMKAWETEVEKITEPGKKFRGVYVFEKGVRKGDGANRDSILWEPHLYTIGFDYLFSTRSCPQVYNYFVNQIHELMKTNKPKSIYGKLGYSIIKTKESIRKYLHDIDNWEFYYEDSNLARKKSIINRINDLNCYLLESAFDDSYEKRWEFIYKRFIDEVHDGTPIAIRQSERRIAEDAAIDMLEFFFMMLCRSPQFDAMGIYKQIKERILYPVFEEKEASDELMTGIWYSELYKMFFKKTGGFYHNVIAKTMEGCQMILFEAEDDAGTFITTDNPSFQHISVVARENSNGFVFPITPKYLLFIGKGDPYSIDIVDYHIANRDTIQHFNKIIQSHKKNTIIASDRIIDHLI
ncbi:MAG: DUF4238 domain-containing protein [Peptostreptococcaceae bacterium]|nr:DUF4238 domain-containing protein [Peptostreptococcaceae bacterium]